MSSLARTNAASRNGCRALVKYFDLEKYTKASPEMKSAVEALDAVLAGNCKCGNARPARRFLGCGVHLSCEVCHEDYSKVADRRGKCTVAGCMHQVCFPCRPVEAFDAVQEAAKDAFKKLDRALELEEQKDVGEGARRRAEALGRDPDAAPANNKKRKQADMTEEEWAEEKERRAGNRAACAGRKRKLAVYEAMEAELGADIDAEQVKAKLAKAEAKSDKFRARLGWVLEYLRSVGADEEACISYLEAKAAAEAAA